MSLPDGYSLDELLQIGTRKKTHTLNISAADINSPTPFVVAQEAHKRFSGFTEEQLKNIGEHKVALPPIQPCEINAPFIRQDNAVEAVLDKLQNFLGIRTK